MLENFIEAPAIVNMKLASNEIPSGWQININLVYEKLRVLAYETIGIRGSLVIEADAGQGFHTLYYVTSVPGQGSDFNVEQVTRKIGQSFT